MWDLFTTEHCLGSSETLTTTRESVVLLLEPSKERWQDTINDVINKTSKGTNLVAGDGKELTIKGSANAYTYNHKTDRNISITVGDWLAGDIDVYDAEKDIAYYFFAVVEDGIVSDIITHSVPGTK